MKNRGAGKRGIHFEANQRTERLGAIVEWFGSNQAKGGSDRPLVTRITAKQTEPDTNEWLIVIAAVQDAGPVVAFHSDYGFAEALRGSLERYMNKGLKWKVDEYALKGTD